MKIDQEKTSKAWRIKLTPPEYIRTTRGRSPRAKTEKWYAETWNPATKEYRYLGVSTSDGFPRDKARLGRYRTEETKKLEKRYGIKLKKNQWFKKIKKKKGEIVYLYDRNNGRYVRMN